MPRRKRDFRGGLKAHVASRRFDDYSNIVISINSYTCAYITY